MIRKFVTWIVLMSAWLAAIPSAWAWGPEGHRLVAEIAEQYLSPVAQKKIQILLRAEKSYGVAQCPVKTLADAATRPDCSRGPSQTYANTFPWHFDDIPCGVPDKAGKCKDGQCLSTQTERLIGVLGDKTANTKDRLEVFKFVTHFIGDAHQPLHAEDNGDEGGNAIPVRFVGVVSKPLNLHHVWDTELLERIIKGSSDPAGDFVLQINDADIQAWDQGDLEDWLNESHQLAKDVAYADLPSPPACNGIPTQPETLGPDYYAKVKDTVVQQIQKAGVRLAKVLNGALN